MPFDVESLVRPHILALQPYTPILPFEVLSQQLGLAPGEIIKLDANENPYGPLPQARAALATLEYPHIYPDPESRALRAALAAHHQVPMDRLLAGAGADELIDLLMRLCLEPGQAIVTCPPTFGMYAFDGAVNGARVIGVPRRADFSLDAAALLAAAVSSRARLVFLASPNNPDGGLVPAELLERLLDLPLLVVLDEAYVDFATPGASWLGRAVARPNLAVLRTFSKWAGLAGLRVGYGLFPAALMPHLWKMKQPYNLSVAAAQAALASLAQAEALAERVGWIVAERERLSAGLARLGWLKPYPSQANFVLCRVAGRSAGEVKAGLARRGILVRYFDQAGLRDHLRISVGTVEQSERLLRELREVG